MEEIDFIARLNSTYVKRWRTHIKFHPAKSGGTHRRCGDNKVEELMLDAIDEVYRLRRLVGPVADENKRLRHHCDQLQRKLDDVTIGQLVGGDE